MSPLAFLLGLGFGIGLIAALYVALLGPMIAANIDETTRTIEILGPFSRHVGNQPEGGTS